MSTEREDSRADKTEEQQTAEEIIQEMEARYTNLQPDHPEVLAFLDWVDYVDAENRRGNIISSLAEMKSHHVPEWSEELIRAQSDHDIIIMDLAKINTQRREHSRLPGYMRGDDVAFYYYRRLFRAIYRTTASEQIDDRLSLDLSDVKETILKSWKQ